MLNARYTGRNKVRVLICQSMNVGYRIGAHRRSIRLDDFASHVLNHFSMFDDVRFSSYTHLELQTRTVNISKFLSTSEIDAVEFRGLVLPGGIFIKS